MDGQGANPTASKAPAARHTRTRPAHDAWAILPLALYAAMIVMGLRWGVDCNPDAPLGEVRAAPP